jgi:hypothetical protein
MQIAPQSLLRFGNIPEKMLCTMAHTRAQTRQRHSPSQARGRWALVSFMFGVLALPEWRPGLSYHLD